MNWARVFDLVLTKFVPLLPRRARGWNSRAASMPISARSVALSAGLSCHFAQVALVDGKLGYNLVCKRQGFNSTRVKVLL
jgi:hypothetical protein